MSKTRPSCLSEKINKFEKSRLRRAGEPGTPRQMRHRRRGPENEGKGQMPGRAKTKADQRPGRPAAKAAGGRPRRPAAEAARWPRRLGGQAEAAEAARRPGRPGCQGSQRPRQPRRPGSQQPKEPVAEVRGASALLLGASGELLGASGVF